MADRVVSVSIRAEVAGYLAGMEKVRAATAKTSDEAQKLEKQSAAFEKVGAGLLTIGAAAAAAVAIAVKSFADFDAQMSQVQSLSHATAAEMDVLRNAALTMGQGIGFSATQVADAETELVKAGVSVKDIMGGALKGALDLAAAGQINVAEATEIAATAMTQFGLSGKDIPHVADLLAAGADKSLGGVEELGAALKQSGLVAAQFGLTVDDTVGTLSEFAAAGLMGSDAGTSLKQMFLQLASPTKQAQAAMEQYHISAYNAQGDFVGITALAGQLKAGFKGVDDSSRDAALSIIFGSDAIRAANILMTDGAKGNQKWINSVNDAGFAAQQAAGKTNNLNGDVKKLGAAFETGLIKSGSASNDVLRNQVQNITALVKAFSDAPGVVQEVALGLTALVAATALAGGGFLTMVPKIAAAKAAMADLKISGESLAKGFFKGGLIALGVTSIVQGFANLGAEAELTESQISRLDASLTKTLKNDGLKSLNAQFSGGSDLEITGFDAITSKVTTMKQALDSLDDNKANIAVGKWFDGATGGLTHLSDTAKRFEAQFKQMGTVLATTADSDLGSAQQGFASLVKQMGGGRDAAKQLLDQMEPYKTKLIDLAGAQGKTLSSRELLNLAEGKGKLAADLVAQSEAKQKEQLQQLQGAAQDASGEIQDLADTITNFGKAQLDVNSAQRDFQAAIDGAAASLKENGATLDLNTEKGRANSSALDAIASSAEQAASTLYTQTGSQEQATAALQTGRDALIKAGVQYGLTQAQAEAYADQVMGTPKSWATAFSNNAGAAGGPVSDLNGKIHAIPTGYRSLITVNVAGAVNVDATANAVNRLKAAIQQAAAVGAATPIVAHASGGNVAFASGGAVYGPGTSTSDSIDARLSTGEHVLTASDVQKMGGQRSVYGLRAAVQAGRKPRFAEGGAVTSQALTSTPRYASHSAAYGVSPQSTVGPFEGTLYLDSGELLGVVRGQVQQGINTYDKQQSRARSNGSRGF